MSKENLKLWESVEKTNPNYTKKANVKGNQITSIAPQYQIKNATEHFGVYGDKWGFRNINIDYTLVDKTGLIYWSAEFYFPNGSFPATNTISVWRDGAMTKPDDQFAKKVETDSLTKCLSKLGFNADIFLGKFDDVRYVEEMRQEFNKPKPLTQEDYTNLENTLKECETKEKLTEIYNSKNIYKIDKKCIEMIKNKNIELTDKN